MQRGWNQKRTNKLKRKEKNICNNNQTNKLRNKPLNKWQYWNQGCFNSRVINFTMKRTLKILFLYALHYFSSSDVYGQQLRLGERTRTRRTKVLILGAGVAGLVAAKTLQEKGINDFLILEAQDYIGGRFKQRSFAGVKLEEGANWIHCADDKQNPLWELKKKHNLRGIYTNYSDVIIK